MGFKTRSPVLLPGKSHGWRSLVGYSPWGRKESDMNEQLHFHFHFHFSYLEPVCCSMSSSICCFLTCIQISQDAGYMVWYSHLFQNFLQFVVIHTVKGFSVVSEAEVDVFLEFPCFFYDPVDVDSLLSGSSAFSESNLYIWKFSRNILLKPSLKDFEHHHNR